MNFNNKYNNFIEKIDTSDEFKKQLIDKINKEDLKKETINMKIRKKIIGIISALSIFSVGGVVFAVTMPEEWKNSIKEFLGIISNEYYEEAKIETNETRYSNGYSLTLENYGIDAENLLLSYNLKTAKDVVLSYPFIEEADYYYEDSIKILDKNTKTVLFNSNPDNGLEEPKHTILIKKISNTEYNIYEIYELDSNKITDNAELTIDFSLMELPENAQGLEYESLADFKFETSFEKAKINYDYKEYDIKNKEIVLKATNELASGEKIAENATLKITKLKNTNFTSKFTMKLDGYYHTNTDYTISIIDENNNIILNKDIQYILGGIEQDVIVPNINMDSKIKITLYEEEATDIDTKEIIEAESIEIDLSNFLND